MFQSDDLLGLGNMANWVKEQKTGDRATFVVNRQINPTNICVLSCRFCDYATKEGKPRAYIMSKEDILSRLSDELSEVHVVSGLYRGWSFEEYLDVVRMIHEGYPHIQIKAYTAVEIDFFARCERTSVREIL